MTSYTVWKARFAGNYENIWSLGQKTQGLPHLLWTRTNAKHYQDDFGALDEILSC